MRRVTSDPSPCPSISLACHSSALLLPTSISAGLSMSCTYAVTCQTIQKKALELAETLKRDHQLHRHRKATGTWQVLSLCLALFINFFPFEASSFLCQGHREYRVPLSHCHQSQQQIIAGSHPAVHIISSVPCMHALLHTNFSHTASCMHALVLPNLSHTACPCVCLTHPDSCKKPTPTALGDCHEQETKLGLRVLCMHADCPLPLSPPILPSNSTVPASFVLYSALQVGFSRGAHVMLVMLIIPCMRRKSILMCGVDTSARTCFSCCCAHHLRGVAMFLARQSVLQILCACDVHAC